MQRLQRGKPGTTALLYVPKAIAVQIPEGTEFEPELTEDGILFRRVERKEISWANGKHPK
jgi:hypothetical protein